MDYLSGIMTIMGGICLFFWGMKFFASGVGGGLKKFNMLSKKHRFNRFGYYICGAFTTALIQSSDATTLIAMNMTEDGTINKHDAVSVALGSRLGSTITALIASLGELSLSPIVFAISVFTALVLPEKFKTLKNTLLGLGLFFGGLMLVDIGADIIDPIVNQLFSNQSNNALLFIIGVLVTAIMQSSSVVSSVLAVLTATDTMGLECAVFLLLGASVGTTITPLIVGIRMKRNAKYVALMHISFATVSGVLGATIAHLIRSLLITFLSTLPQAFALAIFGAIYGAVGSICSLLFQAPLEKLFAGIYHHIVKFKNDIKIKKLSKK